jgi:hypothetical protein
VELVKVNAQQVLSAKVMENTKSMLIHAWIAVLVQVLAQQVLSARNNSLILRRTIIRGHRVCGVFFFLSSRLLYFARLFYQAEQSV